MTDAMFTSAALTQAAEVTVQPEKPDLPTEPGSVIIATELRGVEGRWQMMLDDDGDWSSGERVSGHRWHRPNHITACTKARIVPVTDALEVEG